MAIRVLEPPARTTKAQHCAQADRSFERRAFLAVFIAVSIAALITFCAVHLAVRAQVKAEVIHSLRDSQQSWDRARARRNQRDRLSLDLLSSTPALKSAIVRANTHPTSRSRIRALKTLEKFARSAREIMWGEVAVVTAPDGRPLAVAPDEGPAAQFFTGAGDRQRSGVWDLGGILYSVVTTPVLVRGRQVGALSVATPFDFAGLGGSVPVVLVHHGQVVRSTFSATPQFPNLRPDCLGDGCQLRADGADFLVIPLSRAAAGVGFGAEDQILTLQSIDAVVDHVIGGFRKWLPVASVAIGLLALGLAVAVSRALSRPLHQLVTRLERSQASGRWDADFPEDSATREVNLLAAAINRAATAVTHSNQQLDQAALDFVETMAQALDARDPCTAGHSQRVSDYATAIAVTMDRPPAEIETIRQGARLHDIGKLGISDTVLRKPGRLTPEEFDMIKLHPQIGRKILERMSAFERYLPLVELHHEDFDGTGYPYGLKGCQVPLAVRIIRVADVFDALTTDRSYRQAMPLDRAFELIESRAGEKFDPDVVRALRATLGTALSSELVPMESLLRLTVS
jgi:HD-GYP domain-containing protein (c-di-GMP phosphodiesterase class II)